MINSLQIGQAIKNLRLKNNFTQEFFAEELEQNGWGIRPSQSYISQIESGLKTLSFEKLNIVSETLYVKLSKLIEEAEKHEIRM